LFSEFFQNKLVETIQFMEVLNLKDSVEKDSFFRKLPNIAEQLPREIVLKKVLPKSSSLDSSVHDYSFYFSLYFS
jgi:SCY1-like protein 1